MSEIPAKTYIDITATTRWGAGAGHVSPNYEVTRTFSRAQIMFNPCMIQMSRVDDTFGTSFPSNVDYNAAYSKC